MLNLGTSGDVNSSSCRGRPLWRLFYLAFSPLPPQPILFGWLGPALWLLRSSHEPGLATQCASGMIL